MYSNIYRQDFTLFDYQSESKKSIFDAWDKHNSVLFQMPTGTGKTRLFTSIVRDIIYWGNAHNSRQKILIVAHRKELIDQISDCLCKYQIGHGKIVSGQSKEFDANVIVASIQTLSQSRNRDKYSALSIDFVIIDECHHSIAPSYRRLWDFFPEARFLGVTATPWSMTNVGFDTLYSDIVLSLQPKEFIKMNRLSPYDYYSIRNTNEVYLQVHTIHDYDHEGDFTRKSLERAFDKVSIRARLLESYLQFAKGKKGIIYSICRTHSKHICEEYSNAGIRITDIDGDTPKAEREQKINDFKNGNIDVIVNVDIFSEGFDCPDIEFIQLARPTRSLVKYIQQVGRGLHVSNNKERCIILDNVGALYDFGLPDDDRNWLDYYHGKNKEASILEPLTFEVSDEENNAKRTVNLREGNEEMVKIASCILSNFSEVQRAQPVTDIEDIINKNKKSFFSNYGKKSKRS